MLKFSVFIPVYNAGEWLDACLRSVFGQDYPAESIEAVVVDGGSTDNTLEIARRYPARVFINEKRLAHYAFELYGRHATGDLVVMFAADNELAGRDWFRAAGELFDRRPELGALWGRQVSGPDDSPLNHYYELIQNDPLSHFTNRNLESYMRAGEPVQVGGRAGRLFRVQKDRSLVWGANGLVLRLGFVRKFFTAEDFVGDNDIFQSMVEEGHDLAAYVPELQIVHHHVRSVAEWTRKLRRNFYNHFLQHHGKRNMGWAFGRGFAARLVLWSVYAGIPLFSGCDALWRAVRDRNGYWLYHPLLSLIQLWVYGWLTLSTREGRQFLGRMLTGRSPVARQ
jgi:glycosyltransferase involved in cell wall biosynthesis